MEVIIISLPERLNDRLIFLKEYLNERNIDFIVVDAIKKDNGAEGLIETMKKVYELCLKSDFENVLILEDDAEFIVDKPLELIEKCMPQLPKDFDLLYLGCNLFQTKVELYTPNLIQVFGAWALQSVIYSRKGIEKCLKAVEERDNDMPLDTLIVEKVQPDGKSFCTYPMIVSQRKGYSDIQKKNTDYSEYLINRFNDRTKNIT
ncbi:MAG: hypothetical protein ABI091_26640 [Ferruginibacter sp.]